MDKQWKEVLILSDLEPDDVLAIHIMLRYLPPATPIMLAVGEGQVCKLSMAANFMKNYPDFTDVSLCDLQRSDKDYPEDALGVFGTESVPYKTGTVEDFLSRAIHPLILCLMPPRTLLGHVYPHADLAIYGSFNFRALKADPKVLINWMNTSFRSILLYESFLATGSANSIDMHNAPRLFDLLATSDDKVFKGLNNLITIWNDHIYTDCVTSIRSYAGQIPLVGFSSEHYESIGTLCNKIERNLKPLQSICKSQSKQMVLADFGLVLALLGRLPNRCYRKGVFLFDEYTTMIPELNRGVNYITNLDLSLAVEALYKSMEI